MIRPSFSRDQVSDLDLEEEHMQNMMKALPANSDGWTDEVDIQVLFFRLTLDSATQFLFGESVGKSRIPFHRIPTLAIHIVTIPMAFKSTVTPN